MWVGACVVFCVCCRLLFSHRVPNRWDCEVWTHCAVDKQDGKETLDVTDAESNGIEEELWRCVPRWCAEPPHDGWSFTHSAAPDFFSKCRDGLFFVVSGLRATGRESGVGVGENRGGCCALHDLGTR